MRSFGVGIAVSSDCQQHNFISLTTQGRLFFSSFYVVLRTCGINYRPSYPPILKSVAITPAGWYDDLFCFPPSLVREREREHFLGGAVIHPSVPAASFLPGASSFITPFHKQVFWIRMMDLVLSSMLWHDHYWPVPAMHLRKQEHTEPRLMPTYLNTLRPTFSSG